MELPGCEVRLEEGFLVRCVPETEQGSPGRGSGLTWEKLRAHLRQWL